MKIMDASQETKKKKSLKKADKPLKRLGCTAFNGKRLQLAEGNAVHLIAFFFRNGIERVGGQRLPRSFINCAKRLTSSN